MVLKIDFLFNFCLETSEPVKTIKNKLQNLKMPPKKEQKSCEICCENFNKSNHKHAACQYCNYDVCTTCAETYLLGTTQDAHCMNDKCKKAWNQELLSSIFTKKFVGGTYKKRREDLLFERERSLLPETQPYAETLKEIYEFEKREKPLTIEIDKLKVQMKKAHTDFYSTTANIAEKKLAYYRLMLDIKIKMLTLKAEREYLIYHKSLVVRRMNGNQNQPQEERRVFVRACPANDCNGFLSSGWKCGLCEVRVCSDCHEIKETKAQFDARHPKGPNSAATGPAPDHTCLKENVETALLLKNDSKGCPKCAAMIFKIEGCFAKDTPILMWDSTIKMSQDIRIGDVLIGDDGTPRIVEELVNNYDNLFEVTQVNGTKYTVNSKHKLVLKYSGDHKELVEFITEDNMIEITVDNYLKLTASVKSYLNGYKASSPIEMSPIKVKPVGYGEYFGWKVDKNHRFLLPDLTVVRNCDQMYCTQCQTAFSWRTGRIETGRIHNPHYYEFLRAQNGGVAPREIGDIPCGGFPTAYDLRQVYTKLKLDPELQTMFGIIHRLHTHIQAVELPHYTTNAITDNRELRAAFLINKIDAQKFKETLQKNEKARNKKNEIRMVMDMFLGTVADIFRNMLQLTTAPEIVERVDELHNLRTYFNQSLAPISKRYTCVAPHISEKWVYSTFKY